MCRGMVLFVAGLPRSVDPAATATLTIAVTLMAHSCFRCHEHQVLRPNLTVCETDHLCPSSSECDTAALLDLLAASEGIMLALCDAQCLRPFLWKVVKQTKCYHHGHPIPKHMVRGPQGAQPQTLLQLYFPSYGNAERCLRAHGEPNRRRKRRNP